VTECVPSDFDIVRPRSSQAQEFVTPLSVIVVKAFTRIYAKVVHYARIIKGEPGMAGFSKVGGDGIYRRDTEATKGKRGARERRASARQGWREGDRANAMLDFLRTR